MEAVEDSNQNDCSLRNYQDKWMPALSLIALFFFVGLGIWNLANYRNTISDQTLSGMQFGIGGAPGGIISPLPDPTTTPTPTLDLSIP